MGEVLQSLRIPNLSLLDPDVNSGGYDEKGGNIVIKDYETHTQDVIRKSAAIRLDPGKA